MFRDVPPAEDWGLADVIGALPAAQIADGVDVRVLLPGFPDIRRGIPDAHVVSRRAILSQVRYRCCLGIITA